MMHRSCLLALLLVAPAVHAQSLSDADREALIEKLDNLRETAKEKAMGRIGSAAQAFKAGMASDDAAVELYLKCVKKLDFDDKKRSSQDFREWERRQGDRLKDPGTRRSMRHQLRWLVLSLEAAESAGKYDKLAPKAMEALDSIFGNPEQFEGNVGVLREPVTGTVFARAYGLGGAKVDNWPLSPLDISAVFDQVILPGLKTGKKFDSAREQWKKRIRFEGIDKEYWTGGDRGRGKGRSDERSPDYEKWLSETLPDLQWKMEVDLYKAGDQKRSALNMLDHIEQNLAHAKARDWADQFRNLVDPPKDASMKGQETAGPVE
ncbi:hypothetical protein [Luteolibacter marinus]|uniref:hypothetical protein n=1 Tax=Luteolibacter marinus TaxID=2776705 RepID=UPI001867391B|nr:hypothetical protein [Luteolibacter marinus]